MQVSDQKYQEILDDLSGQLSTAQQEELRKWIHESEPNRKVYEKLRRDILFKRWALQAKQIDMAKEFERFEKRINARKRYLSYAAVAAGILLLFSLSLSVLWQDEQFQTEQISQNESIQPGKRGAELILSNGQKLTLQEVRNPIEEKNGHVIAIDSLNGLNYSLSNSTSKKEIYNTLRVPRGRKYDLLLADGTRVWLNADSELKYPVQFMGEQRKVYLKGEAYFEVVHQKKAFVVKTYEQEVKVYGTEFCVSAYNREEIKTVLVEGSVGVKVNEIENRLSPGELGLANLETGKVEVKKVHVRPYVAWKDGDFVFEKEKLENIMLRLERWYNVKVFYMNPDCKNYRFTCDMKRYTDVEDLLFFLQASSDVKFEVKNNTIVVMQK